MKALFTVLFCLLLLLSHPSQSIAQIDSAGIVKTVSGEVFLTRSDTMVRALSNMAISQGDSLKTGANSSVGLIFSDDTVVSLGPNSEVAIERFLFNPADQELSFIARMVRGTFSFVTGQIAKLAPKKVKLETPDATLGVRGTKLLVKID